MKQTVGIITRHFISNYGSFLQSFATVRQLKKFGLQPEIIDYIPEIEEIQNNAKFSAAQKNANGLKKLAYYAIISPLHKTTARQFARERKETLPLSKQYSEKTINEIRDRYDIYLSGSDQIWGPIGLSDYDLNYFLKFTDSPNKIGYSCSFGHNAFKPEYDSIFYEALRSYRMIGVREQSAVDYLKKLGISSSLVMDPTFFLTKEDYLSEVKGKVRGGYVLCYQLHAESKAGSFAKEATKALGLSVKFISLNKARYKPLSGYHYTADPFEFLKYVDGADYIVTDSFHCTVFSLIFNKRFLSVDPGKTSTRITSLLNLAGIPERYSSDPKVELLTSPINYEKVNSIIRAKTDESKEFLRKELEICKPGE